MRHRPITGIFVVLNTHDLDTREKGEPLPCLYLRDLDPDSSPSQRNSDLMLVRAPAQVVQSLYIATDTSWTPSINYGANGNSGFLYPVFQAAYHGNGELDAADYGHWTSSPYTLSGDDHSAIAYTIPLILDDGTVYGVLGVEILESYLQALLPEGVAAPENRAQTALLLWNTAGRPEPAEAPAFADVADPDTAKAAQWCVEQGLMKRRLNGKFAPGSSIPAYQVLNAYRKLAGG